jgi:hypothetical protein
MSAKYQANSSSLDSRKIVNYSKIPNKKYNNVQGKRYTWLYVAISKSKQAATSVRPPVAAAAAATSCSSCCCCCCNHLLQLLLQPPVVAAAAAAAAHILQYLGVVSYLWRSRGVGWSSSCDTVS